MVYATFARVDGKISKSRTRKEEDTEMFYFDKSSLEFESSHGD